MTSEASERSVNNEKQKKMTISIRAPIANIARLAHLLLLPRQKVAIVAAKPIPYLSCYF